MSDQPTTFYDFEFHFLHGVAPVLITAEDGRWSLNQPSGRIVFQYRASDGVTDELNINGGTLAYVRTTKREVQPVSTIEDSGTLRLVGNTPA